MGGRQKGQDQKEITSLRIYDANDRRKSVSGYKERR